MTQKTTTAPHKPKVVLKTNNATDQKAFADDPNIKVIDLTNASEEQALRTLQDSNVVVMDDADYAAAKTSSSGNNGNTTTTTTTVVYTRKGTIIRYIHPICWIRRLTTGKWHRERVVTVTQTTQQQNKPAPVNTVTVEQ